MDPASPAATPTQLLDDMIPPKDQPSIDSTFYEKDVWDEIIQETQEKEEEIPTLVYDPPKEPIHVTDRFKIHRETLRPDSMPDYFPTENPLDWVALAAMLLGVVMGACFLTAFFVESYQLPLYLGSLALFHFLEYYITARYNTPKVSYESYLFRNGAAYHVAHVVSLAEYLTEYYFFPGLQNRKQVKIVCLCGIAVMIVGQLARSLAMIHGATNFSHRIVQRKTQEHTLVTTGIYSLLRHPSYFGFFYWALGTQMLLFNSVGFVAFFVVLWSFFRERIDFEERFLVSFFGKEYETYRSKVGTGLIGI
ncbi:Protein-S-isoprenylcysteine O-methyltransferase [Yarrowia sp. B02]|nr:Protein-S-isoprenylcysteine O-methyltransferase [Yarrowia sp. B02]